MRWLTEDAVLTCNHLLGRLANVPTQTLVTIEGRVVLVATDPEGKRIRGCPNVGATIKPCQRSLQVETGYSTLINIDANAVCLDTVSGLTDGTPPGTVRYVVREPGQVLVTEAGQA
jgi:hypothetical protein